MLLRNYTSCDVKLGKLADICYTIYAGFIIMRLADGKIFSRRLRGASDNFVP